MAFSDIKRIVLSDSETKDLVFENDIDVYTAYQYISMRDQNDMQGYKAVLKKEPYLHIAYEPTKEKLLADAAKALEIQLETFESDIFIQRASLDSFKESDAYRSKAVNHALSFLNTFPKNYTKGFFIYGPYRTGKSYFLSAIAERLLKMNQVVVFTFVPDLIRSLKNDMGKGNLEKRINMLKRADVLMLDDLGGEHMSAWFRDEVILPVLQYRLSASLPVFISSNFTLRSLAEAFADTKTENDYLKATRIIQRIQDLTISIELKNRYQ